jgi:hypothetical protein
VCATPPSHGQVHSVNFQCVLESQAMTRPSVMDEHLVSHQTCVVFVPVDGVDPIVKFQSVLGYWPMTLRCVVVEEHVFFQMCVPCVPQGGLEVRVRFQSVLDSLPTMGEGHVLHLMYVPLVRWGTMDPCVNTQCVMVFFPISHLFVLGMVSVFFQIPVVIVEMVPLAHNVPLPCVLE